MIQSLVYVVLTQRIVTIRLVADLSWALIKQSTVVGGVRHIVINGGETAVFLSFYL